MMKTPAIKYYLFFLPLLIILLCQCKKESVEAKKEDCYDSKLLTDAVWYPDKNYNYDDAVYYNKDDAGSGYIGHIYDEMYPILWKIDCNKLLLKNKRNGAPSQSCPSGSCYDEKKIISLTKSVFQYEDNGLVTLYNPGGEVNGNISIKSDLGDFNLTKIAGIGGGGVHTIFKSEVNDGQEFFRMYRINDKFSQYSITISVTGIDLDIITYPYIVSRGSFTFYAGQYYKNDTINSQLTITEFKNDTLKGTFSAKMNITRQIYTPATYPDVFNITEGTFAMKMYSRE